MFKIKRNINFNIDIYKARLVTRGFTQRPGIDFLETFAPVTSIPSVRTILAICVHRGWSLERFDVTTAFLNGFMDETKLMRAAEGIEINDDECLELKNGIVWLEASNKRLAQKIRRSHGAVRFQPLEVRPMHLCQCKFAHRRTTSVR